MTRAALVMVLCCAARTAHASFDWDPTREGAAALPSRFGARLRTSMVSVLPDLRAIDAAAWWSARRVRFGGAYDVLSADAGSERRVRASVDAFVAASLRAGIGVHRTETVASGSLGGVGRWSGEASMAWIAPDGEALRWCRVRSAALGGSRAWTGTAGVRTGSITHTGARLGCEVDVGADVGAIARARLTGAVAASRAVTIECAAQTDPASASIRFVWRAGALASEVEQTTVLDFGDVRTWGAAWIVAR